MGVHLGSWEGICEIISFVSNSTEHVHASCHSTRFLSCEANYGGWVSREHHHSGSEFGFLVKWHRGATRSLIMLLTSRNQKSGDIKWGCQWGRSSHELCKVQLQLSNSKIGTWVWDCYMHPTWAVQNLEDAMCKQVHIFEFKIVPHKQIYREEEINVWYFSKLFIVCLHDSLQIHSLSNYIH